MVKRKKPTSDGAGDEEAGRKIKQAQPSRMRIFTVRCSLAEEGKEEYERDSSPYLDGQFIIPNRILPGIRRQREAFKTFCASNIRLSKFLQACQNNDSARAVEIVHTLLSGDAKGEAEAGWSLPRSPQMMPPASTDGISLGATRTPSSENQPDQPTRSGARMWRTGSLYGISNEEKKNTQMDLARHMLLIACRFNLVEVAKYILAFHASLLTETKSEFSPVHVASLYGNSDIITEVLRHYELQVDQTDTLGCTALHLMSLTGSIQAVEALLEMGADILAEDKEGRIPLYYAYIRRDRQICQMLWLNMSYIGDQVKNLRLSQCGMNFFPPRSVFARFENLEHLDVSYNSLHYLEPAIGCLEHLTSLEVSNNPLSALSPDFSTLSVPEQLQYLRFLKDSQTEWNQRRVVVLGCPRVGKSALISALSLRADVPESAFSLSSVPASLGRKGFRTIRRSVMRNVSAIEKQDVPSAASSSRKGKADLDDYLSYVAEPVEIAGENGTVSALFWEVNGTMTNATKLFLSGDVIFMVVYNLEELELLDLDAWMDSIQSTRRADYISPILFVGTHVSNPHCTVEHIEAVKETLLDRYPRSRYKGLLPDNFFAVDSITGAGMEQVRERLVQFIQVPKYADRYFPPLQNGSWLLLREYLRYQPFSFMLKEDLSHVLYACDIPKTELQASLQFLSSVTNVLHFPLSRGRHLLVLDLAWWASMVNHLLDAKNPFLRQGGLLQHDELLQHFREVSPDGIRDFISVMEEAQLVFPLRGELMISELLQSSKPEQLSTHWPTIPPAGFYECQRIYRYNQSAKRLFAYLQQEVLHSAESRDAFLVWRGGVLVQVNNQQILIVQSVVSQNFQIHIHIRYPQTGSGSSCGMMLVICEILENLLRSSYAFCAQTVVRLVPCVHCLNLRALTGKPFLFSYDECYRAVTEGKPFLFCNYIESPSRCVRMDKLAPDLGFADIPQISEDLFTTGRLLGQGGFGSVYHGVLKGTKEIAIKELVLQQQRSEQEQVATFSEFLREAFLMSFLQHPNLVSLYGVCLSRPPRLLMEFVPCGDLKELILSRQDTPLEPWLIAQIAFDVALGMSHLHSISPPIIHRDLRSPNVFLVSLEHGASVCAKIADFGLSRMKSSAQIGERLSTYQWMAPETLGTTGAKVEYDEKADVYSYGMVLWEMLTRAFPFEEFITQRELTYINPAGATVFNDEEVKAAIEQKRLRPTMPDHAPEQLKLLIRQCWSHSPAKRPSFEAIVQQLGPLRHFASSSDQSSHIARLTCAADLLRKNADLELDVANDIRCTKQFTIGADVDEAPCTLLAVEKEKRLWVGCLSGSVIVFDLRNPQNPRRCASWQAHVNAILAMEAGPTPTSGDGQIERETEVWLASADGSISVYPANSLDERRRIRKWSPSASHISRIKAMKRVHQPTKNRHTVWVIDAHGEVSVWDQTTYERVGTVKLERPEGVDAIVQHPDGTVWVGWQDSICLFDPESLEMKTKFQAHPGAGVTALVNVGEAVWSGGSDGQILVWMEPGTSVRALTAHSSKIFCLATDNSQLVWSGSFDKTIILWDRTTYQPREELSDHTDSVKGLACFFHQMWSISLDNTLRCWS